ncbi:MAG: HAMP domain-containing histidine kinase [Bacteroidales bacterium]|jgi:nitrogen fixation/metabolism regulation signal transduction histidine kinase|nr:HAMP domain-containing histidine kinase [Bacteroidales bacterium]MCI1784590.1 HAMP domain-containing histidine kinase [Bacteroidales bacterium]
MNIRKHINDILAGALILASIVLFLCALTVTGNPGNSGEVAAKTEKIINKRLATLDTFIDKALHSDYSQWLDLKNLPEDMVIYRYLDDTLQSWTNQFSVTNDDISNRMVFQRLSNLRDGINSPLTRITDDISYVNYGPKWYLVKAKRENDCKIIAGLEVMNTLAVNPINGINPRFHLNRSFTITPLSDSDGSPVRIAGKPLMKIVSDANTRETVVTNTSDIWIALLLFILGIIIYITGKRILARYTKAVISLTLVMTLIYLWGRTLRGSSPMFSPNLYADGNFMYSMGAVMIMNLYLILLIIFTYTVRYSIFRHIFSGSSKRRITFFTLLSGLLICAIALLTNLTLRSVIMNSSISLELYKLSSLSVYSLLVYFSYTVLLVGILLLIQMLRPYLRTTFGIDINIFSRTGKTVSAMLIAIYLVVTSSVLGFRKEQNRVDVWANRLSIDRDISLEIQLRAIENSIAENSFIKKLSVSDNNRNTILNRITENYFYRISQDYDISIYLFNDNEKNAGEALRIFNDRIINGTQIFENSRFSYSYNANGHIRYTGIFVYTHRDNSKTRLFLGVEPKSNKEDRGYSSILGFTYPGKVTIPHFYSYAKYLSSRLITFKGSYAYPTILPDKLKKEAGKNGTGHLKAEKYVHFINRISDNELIIISRQKIQIYKYLTEAFFTGLIAFLLLSLLQLSRKKKLTFEKNYYKSRINTVLMLSLIMTLVIMASISILFVYGRNDANMRAIMTNKINAIQAILESRCQTAKDYTDLKEQDIDEALEDVGNTTKTDVTLFSPSGKAFTSTTPEIFDKMILGWRFNEKAYDNIIYKNKRFSIDKEKIGPHKFYSLNAPLFNADGKMIALLSSPYTDESYDFKTAAAMNIATVVTVFMMLLILARLMTTAVVDKMFKPLIEMGKKMNSANINSLEYIIYERDDEISSLVRAYNLMVHDLSESTRKLTQAERDKAWSEMARQVAHEIKNPLTPMKLQIQRIIRLKQRNDPNWQKRFDEAAGIILEHIDILSDTANEFSTFAKLYSEAPIPIDMDKLLKEEIMMFDNKESIEFSYMGFENATVLGPKPQLTRVFVNLIANAVQAIEIQQKENQENNIETEEGRILISLRNSTKENYYDIVIEDNGPGVKEENRNKLFTPNFTTKSSGTGLGLAICRNILEKCEGEIQYSKSFVLGGACFTVRFPKGKPQPETKDSRSR